MTHLRASWWTDGSNCCMIRYRRDSLRYRVTLISGRIQHPDSFSCQHECVFKSYQYVIFRLRSHDQSFSKVCVFSELGLVHTKPILWAFSKSLRFHRNRYIVYVVYVWAGHENATKCLRCENASVWTGNDLILYANVSIVLQERFCRIWPRQRSLEKS